MAHRLSVMPAIISTNKLRPRSHLTAVIGQLIVFNFLPSMMRLRLQKEITPSRLFVITNESSYAVLQVSAALCWTLTHNTPPHFHLILMWNINVTMKKQFIRLVKTKSSITVFSTNVSTTLSLFDSSSSSLL